MSEQTPDSDLLDEISTKKDAVAADTKRLREVRSRIDDVEAKWKTELGPDSKRSFATAAQGLKSSVVATSDVNELETAVEEIEQALDSPLRDAVLAGMRDICAAVDISLSKQTTEELEQMLESWGTSRLRTTAETYTDLAARLETAPEPVPALTREYINSQRKQRLLDETDLEATVTGYFDRYEALVNIEEAFVKAGNWVPDQYESISSSKSLYTEDFGGDGGQITTHIETINSYLVELRETAIPADQAVVSDLRNQNIGTLSGLKSTLHTLSQQVTTLHDKRDIVAKTAVFDRVDDVGGSLVDDPLGDVPDRRATALDPSSGSLSELLRQLESLEDAFDEWTTVTVQQLTQLDEISDRIAAQLPDAPTLHFDSSTLDAAKLKDDPTNALDGFVAFDEWRDDLETFVKAESSGSSNVVNYWLHLESGQTIAYEEAEAVREELAELLGNRLHITVASTEADGE